MTTDVGELAAGDDENTSTDEGSWFAASAEHTQTVVEVGDEAHAPPDPSAHPIRLALGIAVLAAERLRPGAPSTEAFMTGVGLLQQTATEARGLARRVIGPPARIAFRTVGWTSSSPSPDGPDRPISRSRERLDRLVAAATKRGEATVAAGRADAAAFLQASVSDGIAWAQAQAVPQIVDGMVPHLVEDVVPRLIDGVMPEIRARVLPAVIDDLTHDPRLRELLLEQGRGAVGEATQRLRATTATADDRVESAFRGKGRSASTTVRPGSEPAPAKPVDTPRPPIDEAKAHSNDR